MLTVVTACTVHAVSAVKPVIQSVFEKLRSCTADNQRLVYVPGGGQPSIDNIKTLWIISSRVTYAYAANGLTTSLINNDMNCVGLTG